MKLILGDSFEKLATLKSESVQCCVTSPPYWGLRNYGVDGQLGLEPTPDAYVANMRMIFEQVKRVLKKDGTLWLNLGDSYARNGTGLKPKDLVGIPWRVAFALQKDGWYLRSEIIWHKSNCLPESVTDRPTKAHEHIFLMAKSKKYYYDADAIREPHAVDSIRRTKRKFVYKHKPPGQTPHTLTPDGFCHPKGKNKRDVWKVSTKPFKGAHFATFPPDLIEPCILAGSKPGDTVLDPFFGAGTTGLVAQKHGRGFIGIELNPEYAKLAEVRIKSARAKEPA